MNHEDLSYPLARLSVADGQIERMELKGDEAVMELRDWRGQRWKLHFGGVVLFRSYEFCGALSEVTVGENASLLAEAISVIEQHGGDRKGYPGLTAVEFTAAAATVSLVALVCQDVGLTLLENRSTGQGVPIPGTPIS